MCKRYEVDASKRALHGALIDADLLARVYLAMTGGQTALSLDENKTVGARHAGDMGAAGVRHAGDGLDLVVIKASDDELAAHEAMMKNIVN